MLHEFDGLVPGTFFGSMWFASVAVVWLIWRLIPRRWAKTSHIVRYALLLWVAAGLYFGFHVVGAIVAGVLGALLLYFAIRSFPRRELPRIIYLPRWQRVLRIVTKAVVSLLVTVAFLALAYLCVYAWYATPSPPDFGAYVEGSSDVQSKVGYLFFWLIAPFAVVLAALAEWFRRPLCEDSLSGFDYYWRAFMTVVLAALFALDAYGYPARAIRAAQIDGYVTAAPVLPCPPVLVDCRVARLVQNR